MVLLESVIKRIENVYKIRVKGVINSREILNGVRFINENDVNITHLLPNILYLSEYKKYGQNKFYGNVLFVGCHNEKVDHDSLRIDEDIDLIELFNVIEDQMIISRQIEQRKETLFHILHNGRGVSALLKTAYEIIRNPIILVDSSYSVIDSYPTLDDTERMEIKNNRLSLKSIFANRMVRNNIMNKIYHSTYPFAMYLEDADGYFIFQSIRIKNAVVGYLCVRCIEQQYTLSDLEIIHSLSQMLSIQLQKDDTYNNPESYGYTLFMKDLFAKRLSQESIDEQMNLLGLKKTNYYYIVTTTYTNKTGGSLNPLYYFRQLHSIFDNSITGEFGNRFITLVGTNEHESIPENKIEIFEAFLRMNQLIACVSYVFEDIKDSVTYSNQCNTILTDQLTSYNQYPIIFYRDQFIKHMALLINNKDTLSSFIHPAIKSMKKYDNENETDYYRTLVTYIDNNRNAPNTAKALFIHKSTLFYRFEKMNKLFEVDINNKDLLFAYEYSIKLMELEH